MLTLNGQRRGLLWLTVPIYGDKLGKFTLCGSAIYRNRQLSKCNSNYRLFHTMMYSTVQTFVIIGNNLGWAGLVR